MISRQVLRCIRLPSLAKRIVFKFNEESGYIPVRPLKDDINVLFDVGQPKPVTLFFRLLSFTPLLAFTLEGVTNTWSPLVIGGALLGLILGRYMILFSKFQDSHEIYRLSVNRPLNKFYFTIANTSISRDWEESFLKAKKKPYSELFWEQVEGGIMSVKPDDLEQIKKAEPEWQKSAIEVLRGQRQ